MKKITKGMVVGFISMLLCVGTVYAAYLVLSHRMSATVTEPITITSGVEYGQAGDLTGTMYPNQTYDFSFCVKNANANGNGTQKVGVVVKNSDNLTRVSLSNFAGTENYAWNTLLRFDLVKDSEQCIKGSVKTPSDMTPGDAWVNVDVTRE
jgi:hypothetical protein